MSAQSSGSAGRPVYSFGGLDSDSEPKVEKNEVSQVQCIVPGQEDLLSPVGTTFDVRQVHDSDEAKARVELPTHQKKFCGNCDILRFQRKGGGSHKCLGLAKCQALHDARTSEVLIERAAGLGQILE